MAVAGESILHPPPVQVEGRNADNGLVPNPASSSITPSIGHS